VFSSTTKIIISRISLLGNYERFVERFLYEFEGNFVLEIIIFIDFNIRNKKLKMFYI